MSRTYLSTVAIIGALFSMIAYANLSTGSEIPYFSVTSGDEEKLEPETIEGKVAVIFYTCRQSQGLNNTLSDSLLNFYDNQPDSIKNEIYRAAVVNCTEAVWPITKIWKSRLKENSTERGIPVYGDWDGNMCHNLELDCSTSNFIIVDKNNRVQYFASGKVPDDEIPKIKKLLLDLAVN